MTWFPEKNDPELERLAALIFDLRRELFRHARYKSAHEREWETEEDEQRRERDNQQRLQAWDNETLQVIKGTKEKFES